MVSDPEEADTPSPLTVVSVLTSAHLDAVVLPVDLITGLNPSPKVSLLGGWLGLPTWASLPLDFTVLPGRSKNRKPDSDRLLI